jgi:hypothetical protein
MNELSNSKLTIQGSKGTVTPVGNFSCISKNIVYCIVCQKCGDLYVGETERRLGDRFMEHLRDVKNNNNNKEVSIHFNQNGHSVNNMKVCVIAANS